MPVGGVLLTETRQGERVVPPHHSQDLDLLFLPQLLDDLVDDGGRQGQRVAQTGDVRLPLEHAPAQDQVLDQGVGDAEVLGALRWFQAKIVVIGRVGHGASGSSDRIVLSPSARRGEDLPIHERILRV